jgi:hypothetical protein
MKSLTAALVQLLVLLRGAAEEHKISGPELPSSRFRHRPSQIEDGSMPHEYLNPRAFYRHIYYEAWDLLSAELEHRFKNQHIHSVLAIEQILLKAANGSSYQNELSTIEVSCYKNDIDWSDLSRHKELWCSHNTHSHPREYKAHHNNPSYKML